VRFYGLQVPRSKVSRSKGKRIRIGPLVVIGALVGVLGMFALGVARGPDFIRVAGGDVIAIQTDELQPGSVKFYSYRDPAGAELRFLLARDSGGRLHAAMDACRRCYIYHEGYASSDGKLVCRFCGNRYKLEGLESGLASCVPVKLPIWVAGHTVNIKPADLERERGLF
jgi:uncharacterized membrane protein